MSTPAWRQCAGGDPGPAVASEYWGLPIRNAERLDRESANALWRLRTGDGVYVLKRLGQPASLQWLDFQSTATRAADRAGIPVMQTIPSVSGAHTVSTTIGQCQLRRYVEGRSFQSSSSSDVAKATEMLRALHRVPVAGLTLVPCPSANLESWLAADETALPELEKVLTQVVPAGLAGRAVLDYGAALDRAQNQLGAADYRSWPVALTHGEITGSNLVLDADGGLGTVLDWDAVQLRPRVHDLAMAALFLGRKKRGSLNIDPNIARAVLEQATAGNPLTVAETDVLPAVLELYFVPTADRLARYAKTSPQDVKWYVGWSAEGARRSRELLAPILG
ncbi:phosphotransferase enzyme family protein [Nocardia sp. NPDC050412]|uniref:phosphotransferase enzyme family protein n=1 Tax=Nocardia sp. NPDC050412 TaxID=3364320 RepID=UPI003795BDF1